MQIKNKNTVIFLLLVIITVLTVIILYSNNTVLKQENNSEQKPQQQIDYLNDNKLTAQEEIEKKNVCNNFLKTYYVFEHCKTQSDLAKICKKYVTDSLYKKITPTEVKTEYSRDEVDIDYSSNITIEKSYINISVSDELIFDCTINKNINGMKSSNEYYVLFKLKHVNNEWLINDFQLISVQGG